MSANRLAPAPAAQEEEPPALPAQRRLEGRAQLNDLTMNYISEKGYLERPSGRFLGPQTPVLPPLDASVQKL